MAGSPCQPDHEEAVGGGQHTAARAALLPVAWIAKLSLRRRSHSADASGEDSRGRGSAGALDVLRRHWRAGQGGGSPSRTSRWDLLRTDRAFTLGFARRSSPTRAPDQQLHKGDEHTPAGESVLRSMGGWLSRTRRRLGSPINHVRLARARSAEPGTAKATGAERERLTVNPDQMVNRPDGQSGRLTDAGRNRRTGLSSAKRVPPAVMCIMQPPTSQFSSGNRHAHLRTKLFSLCTQMWIALSALPQLSFQTGLNPLLQKLRKSVGGAGWKC